MKNKKEAIPIKKFIPIGITLGIVLVIAAGFAFFEYILLKLLGFQYDSIHALIFFFVIYLFLEMPISLIANAVPKALKSLEIIDSSRGLLAFVLQTASTFGLIAAIDHFMETISISWQGAFLFALCAGLINFIARKDEQEPPAADSREFREIERKFNSKR